jgi:hypothetical protein
MWHRVGLVKSTAILLPTQILSTLKMEVNIPPKCQFSQDLHSTTSQKTALFMIFIASDKDINVDLCEEKVEMIISS